jgi:ATP-dependent Clp protease ATP-binding subunit ClpC
MEGYNFTTYVREVLQNSRLEAGKLQDEHVGTEHVLLALLGASAGIAAATFDSLRVNRAGIRQEIVETTKRGTARVSDVSELPYTARAKKVLELAMTEARELHHNYVGTEHLLLGLLREEKGVAAQVLSRAGLTLDATRLEVLRHLRSSGRESGPTAVSDTLQPTPRGEATPNVARLVKVFVFWLIILLIPIVLIQLSSK